MRESRGGLTILSYKSIVFFVLINTLQDLIRPNIRQNNNQKIGHLVCLKFLNMLFSPLLPYRLELLNPFYGNLTLEIHLHEKLYP